MTHDHNDRLAYAMTIYQCGQEAVKTHPVPAGQKYPPGTRVRITTPGERMVLPSLSGRTATVLYTDAHAYGGDDVKSYCLDVDDFGRVAWFKETELEAI